uniref:Transmembrane protein n=1 Tax=blood disease bacterium R229 TaxID=741978 RepID=G2ZNS5_9RALS|nr:hypothetical protein BDB_110124 [blood disease bacterium R229]
MSSFRSAWAGAPADIALARTGQSVPLLSAAAALAVAVAVSGWLSGMRHAPAVDATQIESWRARVAQAMEPQALRQLRRLAGGGSAPAQTALGEALLDGRDASLRDEGMRWLETAAQPSDGAARARQGAAARHGQCDAQLPACAAPAAPGRRPGRCGGRVLPRPDVSQRLWHRGEHGAGRALVRPCRAPWHSGRDVHAGQRLPRRRWRAAR